MVYLTGMDGEEIDEETKRREEVGKSVGRTEGRIL
jgi:hypothetical protein